MSARQNVEAKSGFCHKEDTEPSNTRTMALAVVTGSTAGIGRAIALQLASHGYHVVINGRSESSVNSAVQEVANDAAAAGAASAAICRKVFGVAGDLGTADGAAKFISDVDALAASEGLTIDVLVNNLGIFEISDFFCVPDSRWQQYFDVNFFSSMRLSRHWLKGMLERNKLSRSLCSSTVMIFGSAVMSVQSVAAMLICSNHCTITSSICRCGPKRLWGLQKHGPEAQGRCSSLKVVTPGVYGCSSIVVLMLVTPPLPLPCPIPLTPPCMPPPVPPGAAS